MRSRILHKRRITKCVQQKHLESLIKDLLEAPELFGRAHFATNLIFSASGIDGKALRESIFDWLGDTYINTLEVKGVDTGRITKPIKVEPLKEEKQSSLQDAFDTLLPEDSNGKTAE